MNSPYGFPVIDSCLNCSVQKSGYSCTFSAGLRSEFDRCSHPATYPEKATLMVESQPPHGVYILCAGQVKLTSTSKEGKSVIMRIVQPGEFLGLSAVVSNTPCLANAETITPCQTRFVSQKDFLRLMQQHVELSMQVAKALSREYASACREIRSLALTSSSAGRLASLLLSWCPPASAKRAALEIRIKSGFTHEEIASMIGITRETVTRTFSEFKRNGILDLKGSTLVVRNIEALESLAA